MKSPTLCLTLLFVLVLLVFLVINDADAAAVGKGGGVGGGSRGGKGKCQANTLFWLKWNNSINVNNKGMRRKTGGRKSGSGGAGAVLKTGLRPGGKEEKEQKEKESYLRD